MRGSVERSCAIAPLSPVVPKSQTTILRVSPPATARSANNAWFNADSVGASPQIQDAAEYVSSFRAASRNSTAAFVYPHIMARALDLLLPQVREP